MARLIDRSRQDLAFPSGHDSCAAWLYPSQASVYPSGNGEEVPVIVMGHGLSGTRRDRLGAFAERFAAWRNRVSAAWMLGEPFSPMRHASTLHCPWLVCVTEADHVAKPEPAIEAATRAPYGELRTYPGVDHFDIYDGPEHEAVVADEIAFLRRHLLEARTGTSTIRAAQAAQKG